ncbi:MAG TPA: hypothetical protein VM841_01570 [Actinomycetota bacterium]|nr:hypothetical protein [Actinomycetota bacterium]
MGVMTRRTTEQRRRLWRWVALAMLGLFTWSFIASPNTAASNAAGDEEITEPALAAYHTLADASPIRGLIDHQTYLVSAEPAVGRSTSEVALPSQASATAWLTTFGTVDGLHGTTTGNKVPTETTATQPGGDPEQEFALHRGSLGNDELFQFGAGVSRAKAVRSNRPRGFGHAYLANLALLPAPGSPEAPPGSYDPEADKAKEKENPPSPGADDPQAYTPNPKAQMAILSVGSVASTAETFREESKVVSIAVAELNGISIGNRTADGRCTNCITIDSMRVEARTESDGTKDGALASWRILVHRACRVAFTNDPQTGAAYEGVQCLNPNPDGFVAAIEGSSADQGREALQDPNARGVRQVEQAEKLNELFASLEKALGVKDLGVTLRVGTDRDNAAHVDPSDYSAAAVARGLVLEFRTAVTSQVLDEIAGNQSLQGLIQVVDGGCGAVAGPAGQHLPPLPPPASAIGVPAACGTGAIQSGQTMRTLRIAFGQVRTASKAVPGDADFGGGDDDDTGIPPFPEMPVIDIPEIEIPEFNIPPGGGNTTVIAGLQGGPLKMRIDWGSMGIKPWKPRDMAKGFLSGGMALGLWALVRRRLSLL